MSKDKITPNHGLWAYSRNLMRADYVHPLGTFSSHWAACAAMIRLSGNPDFQSLGGDKPEDLALEKQIAETMKGWK